MNKSIVNKTLLTLASVVLIQLPVQTAVANNDFYGIVEKRPDTKAGTWIVGGRTIEVTERAELDEDDGPIHVGSCVEVEFDDGEVEEIETEPDYKCAG